MREVEAMYERLGAALRRGGITRASQGSRTYVWPLGERAPGDARRAVRAVLAGWGVAEGDIDSAELLTSEVVTNAVRHGRVSGVVKVRVRVMDGRLRVDVTDPEPGMPRVVAASDTDEGYRGMAIVAACADAWGWHPAAGGKTVWWTQVLEATGDGRATKRRR
ncbi:ATP-binding protein [Actinomadura meyerae]|nr:ATP-binding protein [Actinomadura meyerae]